MTNLASNLALFGPSNLFVLTSMTYKQGEASFKRTSGRKQWPWPWPYLCTIIQYSIGFINRGDLSCLWI